jgi:hypothetical protein
MHHGVCEVFAKRRAFKLHFIKNGKEKNFMRTNLHSLAGLRSHC